MNIIRFNYKGVKDIDMGGCYHNGMVNYLIEIEFIYIEDYNKFKQIYEYFIS